MTKTISAALNSLIGFSTKLELELFKTIFLYLRINKSVCTVFALLHYKVLKCSLKPTACGKLYFMPHVTFLGYMSKFTTMNLDTAHL